MMVRVDDQLSRLGSALMAFRKEPWTRAILQIVADADHREYELWYETPSGEREEIDLFEHERTWTTLDDAVAEMWRRYRDAGAELWTKATLTVQASGKANLHFDYESEDFLADLERRNDERRSKALAHAKEDARKRGKEPFDLAKLEQLCDTSSEGRLAPIEERRTRFEFMYYVEHPSLMTIADFAAWVERSNKG